MSPSGQRFLKGLNRLGAESEKMPGEVARFRMHVVIVLGRRIAYLLHARRSIEHRSTCGPSMSTFRSCFLGTVAFLGVGVIPTPARAGVCDLSVSLSTCAPTSQEVAWYSNVLASGTYTVDPFLQLKASGTESGYNVAGLELSDIPIVTIGTVEYREFLLYTSETGANTQLSLDQLQVFLSSSSTQTNYDSATKTLNGLTAVYDLDAGGNNWIKLDYKLTKTSGGAAMVVYIPNYLFTQSGLQYVYLYSQLGSNLPTDGSFEEWWIRSATGTKSVTRVPEPGLLIMLGTATFLARKRLRRRAV